MSGKDANNIDIPDIDCTCGRHLEVPQGNVQVICECGKQWNHYFDGGEKIYKVEELTTDES